MLCLYTIHVCKTFICVYLFDLGDASDAGILPRSLDVIFNSIANKQLESVQFKPKCFCDVTRLTTEQSEQEMKIKDCVLKMADNEVSNIHVFFAIFNRFRLLMLVKHVRTYYSLYMCLRYFVVGT